MITGLIFDDRLVRDRSLGITVDQSLVGAITNPVQIVPSNPSRVTARFEHLSGPNTFVSLRNTATGGQGVRLFESLKIKLDNLPGLAGQAWYVYRTGAVPPSTIDSYIENQSFVSSESDLLTISELMLDFQVNEFYTTLSAGVGAVIAPANADRYAILISHSATTTLRVSPEVMPTSLRGIGIGSAAPYESFNIKDYGTLPTQEWKAFSSIANTVTVIEVLYRPVQR